jgi:anti-sigma regulatory factor (Ser/Thr protein kinase)
MISKPAGSRVQVTQGSGSEAGAVVFDEHFDASTLHLLRDRVAACATAAGMPHERVTDVVLAVHELAANTVRHGAGAGRVLIRAAAGALRCQVVDNGPGEGPWPVRPGHGLWIVRKVADEVIASPGPHGSQVTATFRWRVGPAVPDGPGTEAT